MNCVIERLVAFLQTDKHRALRCTIVLTDKVQAAQWWGLSPVHLSQGVVLLLLLTSSIALKLNCSRRAPCYFTLTGDKAPPAALDSSEVMRAFNRLCYLHTERCLSSSQSISVGFSTQDEAMDVARSASLGAYYHADVSYLFKQGARSLWYSGLGLHQLGSRPTFYIPLDSTPLHSAKGVRWCTRPVR